MAGEVGRWIELRRIDAVLHREYPAGRACVSEERGLRIANEQAGRNPASYLTLERTEKASLAAHDPTDRAARIVRETGELGGVDVDEIHDDRRTVDRQILRHLTREAVDRANFRREAFDRSPHCRAGESGQRYRLTGRKRFDRSPFLRLLPRQDRTARQHLGERRGRIEVRFVVGKRHQMHTRPLRQILEDVKTADLVAAIGRKRNAVREEEQAHPRPREIHGPAAFAAQSGSFFHVRTISAYFGFSGFTSRAGPLLRLA